MILYAVYIIDFAGRPMVWQVFQEPEVLPKDGLLSPLLSSIQALSEELTKETGAAEKFQMKGITYHLKSFNDFMVVMVTDNEKKPAEVLNKLGWNFMKQYGDELVKWNGEISMFETFVEQLLDIVIENFEIDFSQSIVPTKKLNTKAIFNISKELKDTAIAMVALKSATAEEIAKEAQQPMEQTIKHLEKLKEIGYLGTKRMDDEIYYFY